MEGIKRKRTQQRRDFTIAADELQKQLETENQISVLKVTYANFIETAAVLFLTEEALRDMWISSDDFDEATYQADQDKFTTYRTRWVTLKINYTEYLQSVIDTSSDKNKSLINNTFKDEEYVDTRRFRLPKLELAKFDGNIKNWLSFWGQYRKIHDDATIDNDDKFQYLLQSMIPNTKARQLMESYPPCGENYNKAVEALKTRFARDELVIVTYVRSLLNLVLQQAKGQEYNLRSLYDNLQTQLQALETLGVTKEKYAAMLFPMVESALPEEILRTWNRYCTSQIDQSDELSKLLLFLKQEVESEDRIELARTGFVDMTIEEPTLRTMTCFATEAKNQTKFVKIEPTCLWCDKKFHLSTECHKAIKMTLEERKDFIKNKKACYICLKLGHPANRCESFPKCIFCSNRHVTLLCPNIPNITNDNNQDNKEITTTSNNDNIQQPEVLICKRESTTLLQTLKIQIVQDNNTKIVRALIDTGAQRSFIKRSLAKELKLKEIGKENLSHCLFGGVQTKNEEHSVYNLQLKSLDNKYTIQITAVEEANICGHLPVRYTSVYFY